MDDDGNVASVNLDIKNPNAEEALEHLPPEQLVESILTKEKRIIEIMGEIKKVLAGRGNERRMANSAARTGDPTPQAVRHH